MKRSTILHSALVVFALAGTVASHAAGTGVDYPHGYRNWTHVKSMVIHEGHPLFASFGGIHHLYANSRALEGYASGRFDDGAVIVFDLLNATTGDGTITEGKRKVLSVMVRDSARFGDTGGWGFEGFAGGDPSRRVVTDAATACFGCHTAQHASDFVFSRYRD